MDLSSETHKIETGGGLSAGSRPLRAGLRVAPSGGEPTGVFVVIEMAVLVLVAALAMASIIVSSNDVGGDIGYGGGAGRVTTSATQRRPAHVGDLQNPGSRMPARSEQRQAATAADTR